MPTQNKYSIRLFGLDKLRVALTFLVIAHHAAQAYGPTGGGWPIFNDERSAILGPFFSVILAVLFLKEKVKFWQWISLLIAIAGVFVLKGADFRIDGLSFALALLSAVLVGCVFTIVRYLGPKEHALTIINYFMVASILGSLFFVGHWRMPVGQEWIWVSAIGVFGLVGQVFMTRAFQLADTNTIAPFKYMELVYALVLGFLFLKEEHTYIALIGMTLVILGMVLNVLIKNRAAKKNQLDKEKL